MTAKFETVHARLGASFFDPVAAADFPKHTLRYRNDRAAETIGLDDLNDANWVDHFGRFKPFEESFPEPLALRYHGHQFRVYNPDIGDGRGFLFAQCRDLNDGRLLDLGTKGSGTTPYSRSGDGRLTLKGGVREVLATTRLQALGVYTSKSLSLIETGEALERHDEPSPTRSAVLVRLAHSHIRIGTFQRLAFEDDTDAIAQLVDHCIEHYHADLNGSDTGARALALFRRVGAESARLCAQWMAAGFVHGVLNTDNLNITGESFDYGPYRFLPVYEPGFTAAYFDETGLYAYGRQPEAVHWALCRLAECLLPFVSREDLAEALTVFDAVFPTVLQEAFLRRLGLAGEGGAPAQTLLASVFRFLRDSGVAPDQFFHDWFGGLQREQQALNSPGGYAYGEAGFKEVRDALAEFEAHAATSEILKDDLMQAERPVTLLYDDIEALWARIDQQDDWSAFEAKQADLDRMIDLFAPLYQADKAV
ncbi:MAG: YdiU family protein [Alphaproteobacteria bacterium]|nr:YdiU family protein [Alphaproteobacteria bacterium SS10]